MTAESFELRNQQEIQRIKNTPLLRRAIPFAELREDYDQQIFERFFPLTRHFALSGMTYVAKICEKIEKSVDEKKGAELEDFLCKILSISAGEFSGVTVRGNGMSLTGFRRESIHYNMFKDTFSKIARDDASRPHGTMNRATRELVYLIRRNFTADNLVYGFVNYYVIETCAPRMVAALVHYLTPKLEKNGRESDYLKLHVKIEKDHARHVDALLVRHFSNQEDHRSFAAAHSQLCDAMERYWNDISNSVMEGREAHI